MPKVSQERKEVGLERKSWQKEKTNLSTLNNMPLSNSGDSNKSDSAPKINDAFVNKQARRPWDGPHQTVLKALEVAQLHDSTPVASLMQSPPNTKPIKNETIVIDKSSSIEKPLVDKISESFKVMDERFENVDFLIANECPPSLISKLTFEQPKDFVIGLTTGVFDLPNKTVSFVMLFFK